MGGTNPPPRVFGALSQCAAAGALGALGSFFGKLGGLPSEDWMAGPAAFLSSGLHPAMLLWSIRLPCYGMLFACNAAMMSLQLKAVRELPSLQATIVNTTTNLTTTGLLGYCVFSEDLSSRWLAGAALVVCGTGLVLMAATEDGSLPLEDRPPTGAPSKKQS
mmetsp:Transcript_14827/g.41712  ORF Transcript_14827/g.41712 Transcript_14827/m.41712 type:complete len:162 (+) Transcript_14827:80-565(+)